MFCNITLPLQAGLTGGPEVLRDTAQIAHFLAHNASCSSLPSLFHTITQHLDKLPDHQWYQILARLAKRSHQESDDFTEVEAALIKVITSQISQIESQSPRSLQANIAHLTGAVELCSAAPFTHQRVPNFPVLLQAVEGLLKSRIPAPARLELLKVGPWLTGVRSTRAWQGTRMCYSLACIELKLVLEELVHRCQKRETGDDTGSNTPTETSTNDTNTSSSTGTGNTSTGTGDTSTGTGDTNTGTGDTSTGTCDTITGTGDTNTGTGDTSTGTGDTNTGNLESIIACCETVENCISELVDEQNELPGELLTAFISDIRMAVRSAMFYLQHMDPGEPEFVPVLRLFMRWCSDDSVEVNEIIATFSALKAFYSIPDNYKEYSGFLVLAVIFQMEDRTFRDYVKSDLGYYLLDISLRSLPDCSLTLAPIFNELLSRDIYLKPGQLVDLPGLCGVFCHASKTLTPTSLSVIQTAAYLILCYSKRGLVPACRDGFNLTTWTCRSVNFLLAPLRGTAPSWLDLQDMWLSSVHSVCELVERSPDEIMFGGVDVGFLASQSVNHSEVGGEVTNMLEDLLSLIVGQS